MRERESKKGGRERGKKEKEREGGEEEGRTGRQAGKEKEHTAGDLNEERKRGGGSRTQAAPLTPAQPLLLPLSLALTLPSSQSLTGPKGPHSSLRERFPFFWSLGVEPP